MGQGAGLNLHTGAAGVDLFFVISGFVMWVVTDRREREPLPFLWRRVRRVAPLYWLATLSVVALAMVDPVIRWDVRPTPEHIALSLAFIPHYNSAGLPFPALAQGWSLTYEALFYLVFALALLLPRAMQFLTIALALSAFFVVGWGNPRLYMLIGTPVLFEFILGMGLGRAFLAKGLPTARWGLAWMILGFAGLLASYPIGGDDPGNWRGIVWGLPAAAIVGGALSIDRDGRWPRMRWLERLGDASYSVYLTHRMAIVGAYTVLGFLPLIAILPLTLTFVLAVGLLVHLWIEKPLLRVLGL